MLRASERYRARHCNASVRMSEEIRGTPQEAPVGEDADQGTEEHAAFAAGNHSYQQFQATQQLANWANGHKYQVFNEQELFLRYDWLEPYFSGHPDRYAIRDDGKVCVIDLKTGPLLEYDYWVDQLNGYYALVAAKHQTRGASPYLLVISKHHGLIQIPAEFPDTTIGETYHLVTNVLPKNASLPTPGRWCRYCPARLVCDQAPRSIEPLITGSELPLGEDGAELLIRLHILAKLVKEKIEYYETLVRRDPHILADKWTVDKGKEYGEITSPTKALVLLDNQRLPMGYKEACLKFSYAKLRDFLVEKGTITKADAKAALVEILGDLLVFKKGKPSVVETVPIPVTNETSNP